MRVIKVLGVAIALLLAPIAHAQIAVPKLIKIVVPFPPGGSNDIIARALAAQLAKRLNNSVIVENKAGAAGMIGADAVVKSPHDGSVLLLTSTSLLTAAATQPQTTFDVNTDLAPVAMIGEGPLVLVTHAAAAFKSAQDLFAAARAKPGALNYGSSGVGSVAHLATELMNDAANIRITHIPYKGASNAVLDLVSGQIQLMLSNYSSISSQLKAGKVKALAVTSRQAHPAFPDLPPLASTVPNYALNIWVGVFAPAGTPQPIIERLNHEINDISRSPELATVLEPDGTVPAGITPAAFGARVREELAQWKEVATRHKIVAE